MCRAMSVNYSENPTLFLLLRLESYRSLQDETRVEDSSPFKLLFFFICFSYNTVHSWAS